MEYGRFLHLIITNVRTSSFKLYKNWYCGYHALYSLKFQNCIIDDIEVNAFVEPAFRALKILSFVNNSEIVYKTGIFNGLVELSHVLFHDSPLSNTDHTFFRPFSRYLYEFDMISSFMSFEPNSFLGNTILFSLRSFNLEKTIVPLLALTRRNLNGLPIIIRLRLIECGIETIESNCFDHNNNLKEINLERNNLKTLDPNIFDNLFLRKNAVIGLAGNQWICDSNLTKLSQKFQHYQIPFEVDNCMAKTDSCLSNLKNPKQFLLKYNPNNHSIILKALKRTPIETFRLYLMYFYNHFDEQRERQMTIFCNENRIQQCLAFQFGTGRTIELRLPSDKTNIINTVCVMEEIGANINAEIDPLRCISIRNEPSKLIEYEKAWIFKESQAWIIATLASLYLFSIIIGAFLSCILFRMCPKLLRGSKRVVIVEDCNNVNAKQSTVMIMPKEWTNFK